MLAPNLRRALPALCIYPSDDDCAVIKHPPAGFEVGRSLAFDAPTGQSDVANMQESSRLPGTKEDRRSLTAFIAGAPVIAAFVTAALIAVYRDARGHRRPVVIKAGCWL